MTISIKSTFFGMAATATAVMGMALQPSSAQAMDLLRNGQILNLEGDVTVNRISDSQFTFDFNNILIGGRSGGTTPPFFPGDPVSSTLLSNLQENVPAGPFNSFLTGVRVTDGSTNSSNVGFNAEDVRLFAVRGTGNVGITLNGSFFNNTVPTNRRGFGDITLQILGGRARNPLERIAVGQSRNTTFSSSIEVVPTPAAVLPALLGMGTAAFRKKKHGEEEEMAIATNEDV